MQDKELLTEVRDDNVVAFEMVGGDYLPVCGHVDTSHPRLFSSETVAFADTKTPRECALL